MDSDIVFIAEICISAKTDLVVKIGYFSAVLDKGKLNVGLLEFGHFWFFSQVDFRGLKSKG